MKANQWKHVAAVVKGDDSQALLERQRNAGFGVEQQQFVSAFRHLNLLASRWVFTSAADRHRPLWTGPVQRVAAQRVCSSSEKPLAQWHGAVSERLFQADP